MEWSLAWEKLLNRAITAYGSSRVRTNREWRISPWALQSRRIRKQIMAVTSSIGPGALNMVTAAGTATANRIPVLFLPSDAYASRQPDPVLQQIEQTYDYNITANDAFKAVSKYWDRIARPEQLMTAAINAMRVLTDPSDTGAVTLCLPQDV